MNKEISARVQLMGECILMHGRSNLSQEQRSGESAAFHIQTNRMRLVGREKKGSYIIRSKLWETDELHWCIDSSYFAPFEHVTCIQTTPILSAFGKEGKSYRYLNLLMPLSGSRYNRSADVVGTREPQSSHTGLDRTHHGWAKLQNADKINPVFPHTYIWTASGQD